MPQAIHFNLKPKSASQDSTWSLKSLTVNGQERASSGTSTTSCHWATTYEPPVRRNCGNKWELVRAVRSFLTARVLLLAS